MTNADLKAIRDVEIALSQLREQLTQNGRKNEPDNLAEPYEKSGKVIPVWVSELVEYIKEIIKDQDDPKNRTVSYIRIEKTDLYVDIYARTHCDGWAEREILVGRSYDVAFFDEGNKLEYLINESEEILVTAIENIVGNPLPTLLVRLFSLDAWDNVKPDETGTKYAQNLPEGLPTELADLAENEACGELITGSGDCNWKRIRQLRNEGYRVYAGDEDSFGWVTGCIQKDDKVLVYG